jgi:two-component system, chemotaxis family, chemotaxis protein CheY
MATVLIADDASFMRKSLKYIVESAGHNVVGMANEGQEALELYLKYKPDLVTLDLLMTGKDGFWALEKIIKADPKARIIMVTAIGNEDRQEEAQKIGAAGYVRKPFKPAEIIDEINKVLDSQKSKPK